MSMQIAYRDTSWKIEGETVAWGDVGNGKEGWTCTCWEHTPPDRGEPPSCYHARVVWDAEFLKIPIEESGKKVVALQFARNANQR